MALIALVAPYVLPAGNSEPDPAQDAADRVEDSGKAEASRGGFANTGVDVEGDARSAQVDHSGHARADGKGSVANRRAAPAPVVSSSDSPSEGGEVSGSGTLRVPKTHPSS